nr:hypothetical protein [Tanacetum cinerariifolium]
MGHFAKECREPISQNRGKRESYKQGPKEEEPAPKALMAIDGIGWDWSYMDNEEQNHALVADNEVPTEFALMAKSSSSSDYEVYDDSYCSKSCRKNTENLNSKISKLNEELSDCETDLYNYKRGLSQVKARLVKFKENKVMFCERIRVLERDVEIRDNKIKYLKNELEQVKKEKESLDKKLIGFGNASKDLDNLLGSQKLDKNKEGLGYSAVPPAPAQIYSPPKKICLGQGNPWNNIDDNVYWDSDCSRHMTGNISYLSEYSLSSKAFRVFNKRTKKVEENLHVDFLENKLTKKGAGPNWLFDIDTLTNSMNYVPVVVVGSSTNISGTKDVASQDVKKDVSSLRYIALLNWFHEAYMETSNDTIRNSDAQNDSQKEQDCNVDVPESSGISNPTATLKVPSADQVEPAVSLTVEYEILTVSSPVLTVCLDISPKSSSGPRLILEGVFSQKEAPSLVEADLSNMETNIPVSPTPTFRIHKDHLKSQIIGPVDTPVQTTYKSKDMEEQSFIATIHQKTNPELLQFCLFSCFLSQEEPKKIFDALKDPSWEEGIDYEEVFALVARIKSIRLFLAYALFMGFIEYQMDVKSAFLYGTIYKEVYVMQPPGFQDLEFPERVYKVEKAMYGLHQAPKAWYGTLSKYLFNNRFQKDTIDQTLFIKKHKGEFLLVQVYVDDIIFRSSNIQWCREFEALMHDKFQMSSMGELTFFLGLQVLQKKDGIFLSQDKYVGDILKKFRYSDVRSANTPMDKDNP